MENDADHGASLPDAEPAGGDPHRARSHRHRRWLITAGAVLLVGGVAFSASTVAKNPHRGVLVASGDDETTTTVGAAATTSVAGAESTATSASTAAGSLSSSGTSVGQTEPTTAAPGTTPACGPGTGALDCGATTVPLALPTTNIAAGEESTCAIVTNGDVYCWGDNSRGELGNGTTTTNTPVKVSDLANATAISVGDDYACAVVSGGDVYCWGSNESGELGNGDPTDPTATPTDSSVAVPVTGLHDATSITTATGHACAVRTNGKVECWGDESSGELGDGGFENNSFVPVTVVGITNAVAISANAYHSCALLATGSVECWGDNSQGQLGNGDTVGSRVPVAVSGITNATALSSGYAHGCAVLADAHVECWGSNQYGQLGDGTTLDDLTPVTVSGVADATKIASGYAHSCVLSSGGTVKCWGRNSFLELGNGSTDPNLLALTPVDVANMSDAASVVSHETHTCAVTGEGAVQCWGSNSSGELGDGTYDSSAVPVSVVGLS